MPEFNYQYFQPRPDAKGSNMISPILGDLPQNWEPGYSKVFGGTLRAISVTDVLNQVFIHHNKDDRPRGEIRSMSTGDILSVEDGVHEVPLYYMVDSFGFKAVSDVQIADEVYRFEVKI